jgi:hypothetical protein
VIVLIKVKSAKNGKSGAKKAPKRIMAAPRLPVESSRTIKYHPGSTTIPREKIREAVKAVVSKTKSS